MKLKCKNEKCGKAWNYKGKKIYGYTSCPDCKSSVKIIIPVKPGYCIICKKRIGGDEARAYGNGEKSLQTHYNCAMEIIERYSS